MSSAQPCGCDIGAGWLCAQHKFKEHALALVARWRDEASKELSDHRIETSAVQTRCACELEQILG